jgi:hypothetical protein
VSAIHYAILASITGLLLFRLFGMRALGWREPDMSDAMRAEQSRRNRYIWLVGFVFAVVTVIGGGVLERMNVDNSAKIVWIGTFVIGWPILGHVLKRYWWRR